MVSILEPPPQMAVTVAYCHSWPSVSSQVSQLSGVRNGAGKEMSGQGGRMSRRQNGGEKGWIPVAPGSHIYSLSSSPSLTVLSSVPTKWSGQVWGNPSGTGSLLQDEGMKISLLWEDFCDRYPIVTAVSVGEGVRIAYQHGFHHSKCSRKMVPHQTLLVAILLTWWSFLEWLLC